MEALEKSLKVELEFIWNAHRAVGIDGGKMRLYSIGEGKGPWRPQEDGLEFWYGPDEIDKAVEKIVHYYNKGARPNTALLLDPVVYRFSGENKAEVLGSGIIWATTFCIGQKRMTDKDLSRITDQKVFVGKFKRGDDLEAGIKMLALADKIVLPDQNGAVPGSLALYNLANFKSDEYKYYYLLSGIAYLSGQGSYEQPSFAGMFPGTIPAKDEIAKHSVVPQHLIDAETCWEAYDRYQSLYERFGIDVPNLERNLKYYNLCARDFELLDATGPARQGSEEKFEFIVPGWLPRGSITLIAGSGGTGKSSIAHNLCIRAATDYNPNEPVPKWLGSPINLSLCNGVNIYFSGEDGPAIVNARAKTFDPENRAQRLMMQRTNFGLDKTGEPATFSQFLKRLARMPDVPVIVIDPARKYLLGDEDDSEVVSNFFEAIEEFAINKKSAVLVVHHLAKGAKPKDYREILDCLRGSQVFIDRPRMVIGMYREGPHTVVGLSKNNIPPSLGAIQGARVFVRNAESLDLLMLPGPAGIRDDSVSEEELEEIKSKARQESK